MEPQKPYFNYRLAKILIFISIVLLICFMPLILQTSKSFADWLGYRVISSVVLIVLLWGFHIIPALQTQKAKNLILFSICLVSWLLNQSESIARLLFGHTSWFQMQYGPPQYDQILLGAVLLQSQCKINIFFLFIVGIMAVTRRWNKFTTWLAIGVFYSAVTESIVMVYYAGDAGDNLIPFVGGWFATVSPLFHSTSLLACIYLVQEDFIKIKVSNILPLLAYSAGCMFIGACEILLYREILGLHSIQINIMHFTPTGINEKGLVELDKFGPLYRAIILVILVPLIYELCCLQPKERFYKNWNKPYWFNQEAGGGGGVRTGS